MSTYSNKHYVDVEYKSQVPAMHMHAWMDVVVRIRESHRMPYPRPCRYHPEQSGVNVRGDHIKISFSPDDLARHAVIRHAVVPVSSVRMYPCMYAQSGASGAELNLQKDMLKSPD